MEQGRMEPYTQPHRAPIGEKIQIQITLPTEEKQYTEGRLKPDSSRLQVPMRKRATKRTHRTDQIKENAEKQTKQATQPGKTTGGDENRQVDINDNLQKKTRLSQENETDQKEKEQEMKKKENQGRNQKMQRQRTRTRHPKLTQ